MPMPVPPEEMFAVPLLPSTVLLAVAPNMTFWVPLPTDAPLTTTPAEMFCVPPLKIVPLTMAPADSQKLIAEYTRDFYLKLFADVPSEVPLPADKLVYAFQRWDQQVGARAGK